MRFIQTNCSIRLRIEVNPVLRIGRSIDIEIIVVSPVIIRPLENSCRCGGTVTPHYMHFALDGIRTSNDPARKNSKVSPSYISSISILPSQRFWPISVRPCNRQRVSALNHFGHKPYGKVLAKSTHTSSSPPMEACITKRQKSRHNSRPRKGSTNATFAFLFPPKVTSFEISLAWFSFWPHFPLSDLSDIS